MGQERGDQRYLSIIPGLTRIRLEDEKIYDVQAYDGRVIMLVNPQGGGITSINVRDGGFTVVNAHS